MNRRGFFTSLAASALVAVASSTRLGKAAINLVDDEVSFLDTGRRYSEYLARSMRETKEILAANILNLYNIDTTS